MFTRIFDPSNDRHPGGGRGRWRFLRRGYPVGRARPGLHRGTGCLVFLLLLLAACSNSEEKAVREPLACRGNGGVFEQVCTSETIAGDRGTELIVRAPGGDFHRLLVTEQGRNVAAADGAEPLLVEKHGADSLYVTADGITYRLPVQVGL